MGLDMYLTANRYISPYALRPEERQIGDAISALVGLPKGTDDEVGRIEGVSMRAGYWRKANQIHAWFVEHIQGGTDDCGDYYVSREQLRELGEACRQVQADPKRAEELLPTQGGFFFGSTAYGDDYMQDLADTVRIVDYALSLPDSWTFEYHSSW